MYILVSECPQFSVHINTFPKYKFCVHFRLNECMLWRLNSRKAYKKNKCNRAPGAQNKQCCKQDEMVDFRGQLIKFITLRTKCKHYLYL